MKIAITMSTRDKAAYADGYYSKDKTVVKAGGRISSIFRGYEKVAVIRNNRSLVGEDGTILNLVNRKSLLPYILIFFDRFLSLPCT